MLFFTYSETSNGQEHLVASCDPLAQVITPRGPSHGKQNCR